MPRRMIAIAAIMIFSQGIPAPVFFRVPACRPGMYPPPVAVTPPPLPYFRPTPGAGFFFHEASPAHWWPGGSRQPGQNFPPQCWQVNGRAHSAPQ